VNERKEKPFAVLPLVSSLKGHGRAWKGMEGAGARAEGGAAR